MSRMTHTIIKKWLTFTFLRCSKNILSLNVLVPLHVTSNVPQDSVQKCSISFLICQISVFFHFIISLTCSLPTKENIVGTRLQRLLNVAVRKAQGWKLL